MKTSTTAKKKKKERAEEAAHCFMEVKKLLNFRLTVSAMQNISVSPGRNSSGKRVVELCGTVNYAPTKKFAKDIASLAACITNGSHKLVNNIKVVTDPVEPGPGDVMCCCPNGGCTAIQGHCPPCD